MPRFVVVVLLALIAAACGSSNQTSNSQADQSQQADLVADLATSDTSVTADDTSGTADNDTSVTPDNDVSVADDLLPSTDTIVSCDDKAKQCASEFGSLFTKSNGRADGTLVALVRPTDDQCTIPNSTHLTIQLSILGQVQRLVVNVQDMYVATVSKPLLGPPYEEGWHENQNIDYVSDLGVHSTDFKPQTMQETVDMLCSSFELGAKVSVFAYSDGSKPSSAHQIHRNDNYPDGAIVLNPTSANPTYLLFRFADQVF